MKNQPQKRQPVHKSSSQSANPGRISRFQQSGKLCTRLILSLEPLERRNLLAGLTVSVSIDRSVDGILGANSVSPAADRIVYIDLNENQKLDASEPVAITDDLGKAFFEGLTSGDYAVGLLTDGIRQRQITPGLTELLTSSTTPLSGQWLIGGPNSASQWGLTSSGLLTLIEGRSEGSNGLNISILQIDGQPLHVIQPNSSEAWISYQANGQQWMAVFDISARSLTSFFVSGHAQLSDMKVAENGQVWGALTGGFNPGIARMDVSSGDLKLTMVARGGFDHIEVMNQRLIAVRSTGSGSQFSVFDLDGIERSQSIVEGLPTTQVTGDSTTGMLAAASADRVTILRLAGDELEPVAKLAEAAAPVQIAAGRLFSANRVDNRELTMWSMRNWQPMERIILGEDSITDFRVDAKSLQASVLTENQLHHIALASPKQARATLTDQTIAEVQFSLQSLMPEAAVEFNPPPTLRVTENSEANVDLRQLLDVGNDQLLWFSLVTPPTAGEVQLSTRGSLNFRPAADFHGSDQMKVRVHDGVSSVELAIEWVIDEVNRPPTSILVQLEDVAEDLPVGSSVGLVTVNDPNASDTYSISIADHRFRVEGNRIVLNEALDFESAKQITFQVTALDAVGQFSISTESTLRIRNVREKPEGVILSDLSIPENSSGVLVGTLKVVNPDAEGVYQITVNDPRFEVRGNDLYLNEPLNFEQSSQVSLGFVVTDKENGSLSASNSLTLQVTDVDDPPLDIEISLLEVAEKTPGAIVGNVRVIDEDGGNYTFLVSDPRFVVEDGVLRLTDNARLNRSVESNVPLTITASAANGLFIAMTFPIVVITPPSPWQNPSNPVDVNGDGRITARDALFVINFLNNNEPGALPPPPGAEGEDDPPFFPDVNGDGRVTPIDALLIINELNRRSFRAAGEGEGGSVAEFGNLATPPMEDAQRRQRSNREIDAELELLLNQLAREQA